MGNDNLIKAEEHIKDYLKKYLPQYSLLEVRSKSYHPDDAHLFMVSAKKKDGAYAVWTSWNEKTQSLNYGHYGLDSLEDCGEIFKESCYSAEQGGAL